MDLAISRLEHISAGDIGNFHAINAYRMNHALPTGEGSGSLSAWDSPTFELDKGMGLTPMIGRQYAYFHKLLSFILP